MIIPQINFKTLGPVNKTSGMLRYSLFRNLHKQLQIEDFVEVFVNLC